MAADRPRQDALDMGGLDALVASLLQEGDQGPPALGLESIPGFEDLAGMGDVASLYGLGGQEPTPQSPQMQAPGFWERLAQAGGVPQPRLSPQGATQGAAAGLVGGLAAFLNSRSMIAAHAARNREEDQKRALALTEQAARERNVGRRQIAVAAVTALLRKHGDPLGPVFDTLARTAAAGGPNARAVIEFVSKQHGLWQHPLVQGLYENTQERHLPKWTTVTIGGQSLEVPETQAASIKAGFARMTPRSAGTEKWPQDIRDDYMREVATNHASAAAAVQALSATARTTGEDLDPAQIEAIWSQARAADRQAWEAHRQSAFPGATSAPTRVRSTPASVPGAVARSFPNAQAGAGVPGVPTAGQNVPTPQPGPSARQRSDAQLRDAVKRSGNAAAAQRNVQSSSSMNQADKARALELIREVYGGGR